MAPGPSQHANSGDDIIQAMPAPTERHHAVEKTEPCVVASCKEDSVRHMSKDKVEKVWKGKLRKNAVKGSLCKKHYKEFKKETQDEREMDRAGW